MARGALRLSLLATVLTSAALALKPSDDFETVRTSNAAILNRLGLVPLPNPDASGHHRKRLAPGESNFAARVHQPSFGRRHSASGRDSHVYVVKLPASPPYYSFSKPHKDKENVTVANPDPGFKNNGKPAKIYHWNLPLVKKINEKRKQMALLKIEQARKKLEADRERQKVAEKMSFLKKLAQEQLVGESQRKPTRNNDKWLSDPEKLEARTKYSDTATQMKILSLKNVSSPNKVYRLDDGERRNHHWHQNNLPEGGRLEAAAAAAAAASHRAKKHKKKSAGVSYYYAPVGKSASTSISKHFSGNGKPKAFYVMEKSRKPAYYHPLMP
ncbi:uncharacterized protein LOC131667164 [Phymastichus coffea]|uniref:uncharacterized protein LOC131667164 n=1 Tax=Phymastichus coffea TaxID=108790 RepID=UPI00273B369E|nr:uncharacterized protein LOC131667164 [Phymastichus coffea]